MCARSNGRRGRRGVRNKRMIRVAQERIETLFSLAQRRAHEGDLELADRYVWLARKIGMRYNLRLPRRLNLRICANCYRFLLPNTTARIRTRNARLVICCSHCGHIRRIPFDR